jgi:CBS domain containing-hemolysin-like protein
MSWAVWIVIVLLILANAFYVAAEFAAVGVRRSRVRRLSEDGNIWARQLLPHVENPARLDTYVAVSQVGITLSSLILGAVGQGLVAIALGSWITSTFGLEPRVGANTAAIIVLLLLTAAQVVLSELIPKSLSLQYPTEVALATVLPMRWSLAAFKPLILLLNGSATGLLKLLGVSLSGHRHLHSPDEIALLFAESRDGGLLEPAEQARLHKALRLGRQTARELMVPRDRLAMVDAGAPWTEALRVVAGSSFSRFPVFKGSRDNIIGTLRVKDLVHRYLAEGPPANIESLVRPFVRVPSTLAGDQVIATLRERRAHQAAVIDEAGTVIGVITIQDALGEFLGADPRTP